MSQVTIVSREDPCICPQCPVLASIIPNQQRLVEPIGYDEFCAVLESGEFLSYHEINGLRMIQLPRAMLICNADGCTMIRQKGTDMEAIFAVAFANLDAREALAA